MKPKITGVYHYPKLLRMEQWFYRNKHWVGLSIVLVMLIVALVAIWADVRFIRQQDHDLKDSKLSELIRR